MESELACSDHRRQWLEGNENRLGQITAPHMAQAKAQVDCCGNVTGSTHSIIATVMSYHNCVSSATAHGRHGGATARKCYKVAMRKTHQDFQVTETAVDF